MMKLIEKEWIEVQYKHRHVWLAQTAEEITAGFDPDSAEGSMILVISTGETYIKNTEGKWQKVGSTEVVG